MSARNRPSLLALVALFAGGCSFLFVNGPSPEAESESEISTPCTTGVGWPIADAVVSALEIGRTVYVLDQPASAYRSAIPLRGIEVGLGVGLAALFAASAITGFVWVRQCDALVAQHPLAP